MSDSEILNGLREIKEFWDPYISEASFKKHILPLIKPHLFDRRNSDFKYRRRENIPRYYIYKTLLINIKVRYENNLSIKKHSI